MSAVEQDEITATTEPMPTLIDLPAWDEVVSRRDDSYELVEGVPTMTPGESYANRGAGVLLAGLLNAARGNWIALTDMDLTVSTGPRPTVRRPDVVVARRRGPGVTPAARLSAAEVLLVAEVVSPTSVERDLVTKRREFARAGLPAYLVVDLRAAPGTLTLFSARDRHGSYVEEAAGTRVRVTIDGVGIDVTVADLVP